MRNVLNRRGLGERPREAKVGCSICRKLEQAYEAVLGEYNEARSSAGYRISTRLAARKNVEMERAREELEEHRSRCAFAAACLPRSEAPKNSGKVAA
jgi:hypothetical protein